MGSIMEKIFLLKRLKRDVFGHFQTHYATHRYAVVDAATINRQKMVNFMMMLVLDRLVKLNCDKERFLGSSFSCCLALVRLAWEQARDGERHRLYKWNFLQRNERFRPLA